jgi:mono/diheme cytochrome c family protein
MKNSAILGVLLFPGILILPVSSCVMRKTEPLVQKEFIPANERIASGERIFMSSCQKCHPSGESGLGPAILANPAPQFIKRFQMRHGLGAMPGFRKNELSKKELHDISKYLRAWKKYK